MEESLTHYGAVETIEEGKCYARFLQDNQGKYDGIIVCLPNFGDENGAYYALKDAKVPILMQAYPDELGKMDFARRRDAVCGKIAMCNVLRQAGIKYSLTKKFADFSETFAKCYIDGGFLKEDRKVLIIKAAVGGTGFARKEWGVGSVLFNRLNLMVDYGLKLNKDNRIVAFYGIRVNMMLLKTPISAWRRGMIFTARI